MKYLLIIVALFSSAALAGPVVIWGPSNSAILLQQGITVNGATASSVFNLGVSSPGAYGNAGIGGPASVSDQILLAMSRTYGGLIYTTVANPSTAAGAGSVLEVQSDNGSNSGMIMSFDSETLSPAVYAGGGTIIRSTTSGTSADLRLLADASSTALISFWINGGGTGNQVMQVSTSAFTIQNDNHLIANVGTGTLSATSCGSGTPTVAGSDVAGQVTVGTGGTVSSCTVNFAKTWTTVPHCFLNDETQLVALKAIPTATTLVISATAAFTASSVIDYFCINHQ